MAEKQSDTMSYLEDQLREVTTERDAALQKNVTLAAEVLEQKKLVAESTRKQAGYERIRKHLARSYVIRNYFQPVLVVGPRFVGKTSLIKQWQVPWDHSPVAGTMTHRVCEVPI